VKKLEEQIEVIVVDDGSTDGTSECAENSGVKVLRHGENKGYGAALKTGIRNASCDLIAIADADGTYPVNKLPELVNALKVGNYDMVVGARIKKHAKIPAIRRPAKWFITKLASFLSGVDIPDLNSGLRVVKKDLLQKYIKILPDGFSFTSTITLALLKNSYRIKYVPINYYKRDGVSKIRPIHDTLNFVQLIIRTILYFDPLKVFLPISLPMILFGVLLIIFQAVFYRNVGTISVIILLAGIQLLAIGMIADLIDKRTSE
jgi:glycosyltransferase involved in cell wall biosynthesis